ncbi:MAG: ribosome small subunit-dependent GTPase A [Bacteroidales bacterium]|jgi:ribosome biogenesis GTPase / thiamine phosphate phosphatase|nr:ribosome small subunit-dependent GTPase A [Bacteroidales bacterium]MCI1732747.1 ribosome small subunit-dependent GTPase A [Bacteroidales bacterium]
MRATVVKHTGSHYLLSKLPEWNLFPAVIKGKMRLEDLESTNPIAVGDIVEYEQADMGRDIAPDSSSDGRMCIIKEVLPRKNCIIRKSTNLSRQNHVIAANLDKVFLTVTMADPQVKPQFVDRFLVTCEAYGVPVTILINKADIYLQNGEAVGSKKIEPEERKKIKAIAENFKAIYNGAGYEVLEVSAITGLNINILEEECKNRVVLFSGQSGVGKSSLINKMDPGLDLKTAEISAAHLQGKHTTTFYQMHPLVTGGFVIDTPGIRGFGLVNFKKEELSNYFPEMLKVENNCKFAPCTHTHEPGCAVKAAVENGTISPERYYSYLAMLEEDTKYRAPED